jgi:peptidoglycan/LPS O-acetylase OafA/YrhL
MIWDLPGVFADAPFPNVIDGSLWSIRVEVLCYFGVVLLGLLGLLRSRIILAVIAVLAVGVMIWIDATHYNGPLIPHVIDSSRAEPVAIFIIGMLARAIGSKVVPRWWMLVPLIVLWVACFGTPLATITGILAIAGATLATAFRLPSLARHPTASYDLSYGTYIIAFPVQQLLVHSGISRPIVVLTLSVLIVLPLSALSWRWIERPALLIKPRRPSGAGVSSPAIATGGGQ